MSSVTLGMTTKGINSTSRQISGGVTVDAKLKDPVCGLHKPVFKVKGLSKSYNNYNYCTWRGRYYWVDEIVFLTNDIQEVHCHLDPLATFKGAIDETPAFVVYGDKGHCEGYVDDVRIGPEKKTKAYNQPIDVGLGLTNFGSEQWTVIMTVTGSDPENPLTQNSVGIYAMPESTFWLIMSNLYTSIDDYVNTIAPAASIGLGLAGFYQAMAQGTPIENIKSVVAVPISISKYYGGGSVNEIWFGGNKIDVGVVYKVSPKDLITGTFTLDLQRPTFNQDYRFLNSSKYFSAKICHPGGSIPIDVDSCIALDKVYVHYSVSKVTGDYVIEVTTTNSLNSNPLGLAAGNVSYDMIGLIGNQKSNLQVLAEKGIDIGMGIAKMIPNPIVQAAATVTETTTYAIDNQTGEMKSNTYISSHDTPYQVRNEALSTSGITGIFRPGNFGASSSSSGIVSNFCALGICDGQYLVNIALEYYYPQLLDNTSNYEAYCDDYGYPVNDYVSSLNAISGYVQCAGAFVRNIPGATTADISTINSFLNNGIVLEN